VGFVDMGTGQVPSKTFAKVLLLFFAVLFTAVLIHPDVDLLDVHDVKINNARSQFRSNEGQILHQAPILFAGPQIRQSAVLGFSCFSAESDPSCEVAASSVLRV
jgi:hypothetical protein